MSAGGAPLVEIALAEGDLDAAWAAAQQFGAGRMWQRPETRAYPGIARQLATVRDLYERAGDSADFADHLQALKATYGRRPALMAALAKKRLWQPNCSRLPPSRVTARGRWPQFDGT